MVYIFLFPCAWFTAGFWGVCGPLMIKKRWRCAYIQFLDNVQDKTRSMRWSRCMWPKWKECSKSFVALYLIICFCMFNFHCDVRNNYVVCFESFDLPFLSDHLLSCEWNSKFCVKEHTRNIYIPSDFFTAVPFWCQILVWGEDNKAQISMKNKRQIVRNHGGTRMKSNKCRTSFDLLWSW